MIRAFTPAVAEVVTADKEAALFVNVTGPAVSDMGLSVRTVVPDVIAYVNANLWEPVILPAAPAATVGAVVGPVMQRTRVERSDGLIAIFTEVAFTTTIELARIANLAGRVLTIVTPAGSVKEVSAPATDDFCRAVPACKR